MDHPRTILQKYGLKANKKLGQHFIYDENILTKVADLADLTKEDTVLEIGPGFGSLTQHLTDQSGSVIAIELDNQLITILRDTCGFCSNLEIIRADILEWLPSADLIDDFKVVANLPYYITGAILRALISREIKPKMMILTVQKEVAQRIVARPGSMSLLSVAVQLFYDASLAMTIKAGSFWPPPLVDSAVIKLERLPALRIPTASHERLFAFIRVAFAHKRKKMINNLGALGYSKSQLRGNMEAVGIDPGYRAQALSVEQWVELFLAASGGVPPP